MSNDELNLKLYQKMQQEQEKYRDWLKGQSPDVILRHALFHRVRHPYRRHGDGQQRQFHL